MTKPLTVEQYSFYKTQPKPLSDNAIMKIHKMHNVAFNKWKHENDLIGKTFEPAVKSSDVKTTDAKLLKENEIAQKKGWGDVVKTIEGYSPNAKVKEKLQETPKLADSSDSKPKQEQSPSEDKERRVTAPADDKKDIRIRELEWRVNELIEKNEFVIEERNAAREFLRQEREKSKEIIEDQADEIEGLKAEIAHLKSQPNHAQLKGDMLKNLMKLYLQEVEG